MRMNFRNGQWRAALLCALALAAAPKAAAFDAAHVERLRATKACDFCDLSGADLEQAELAGARIAGADLENACLCNTILPDGRTEMSGCRACDRSRPPGTGETSR
jgi:uncharacterized protein YjbI with pentapeptide repeats